MPTRHKRGEACLVADDCQTGLECPAGICTDPPPPPTACTPFLPFKSKIVTPDHPWRVEVLGTNDPFWASVVQGPYVTVMYRNGMAAEVCAVLIPSAFSIALDESAKTALQADAPDLTGEIVNWPDRARLWQVP